MSEYDFDVTKELIFSAFITWYNDGGFQSGATELSYAAKRDKGIMLLYHQSMEKHGVL